MEIKEEEIKAGENKPEPEVQQQQPNGDSEVKLDLTEALAKLHESDGEGTQADTLTAAAAAATAADDGEDGEVKVVIDEEATEQQPTATEPTAPTTEPVAAADEGEEKMLSQSMVNKLIGKAREEGRNSAIKDLFTKYGVETDTELDDIFGKGQTYDQLNDDYLNSNKAMKDVMAENALLKTQIDEARWDDVKLILTGKGLDVTQQNILDQLASHPEWKKGTTATDGDGNVLTPETMQDKVMNRNTGVGNNTIPSVPRQLGGEVNNDSETEEELVARLFGMK